jgi:hypothetical protein
MDLSVWEENMPTFSSPAHSLKRLREYVYMYIKRKRTNWFLTVTGEKNAVSYIREK